MNLEKALAIPGFTSETKLAWLAKQARSRKVIVEIGSWMGRSTRALADNTDGIVFAVDDWRGPENCPHNTLDPDSAFKQFCENLRDHIDAKTVVPINVASPAAVDVFKCYGVQIELLFIDGDHSLEAVRADLAAWIPLLAEGAMLCGDDFSPGWRGVVAAVREALQTFAVVPGTDLWYTPRPEPRKLPRRSALEKKLLYLGTPAYGDATRTDYTLSFADTVAFSVKQNLPPLIPTVVPNDSHIDRARNGLAADFLLRSPATHLVFIDADLHWRPTDFYRLVSCPFGHDVVCGVYPKRSGSPQQWPVKFLPGATEKIRVCGGCGAVEIHRGPAGFMAISRAILDRIAVAHPELECEVAPHLHGFAFFDARVHEGQFETEDFAFCDLVRSAGGSIWMLPDIPFVHGGKHGCFDVWLREEQLYGSL